MTQSERAPDEAALLEQTPEPSALPADPLTPGDADESAEETARKTGRGFLVITAAKLWFMVTGAVIQLGLPIFLGSAETFGIFKIVTEAISLINMVMITGTLQAVSKLVSERPARARQVVNQAMLLQCLIGVPITLLYLLGSPWIAAQFNDPSLTPYIRVSALIVVFYAFYAVFIGYFNGVKEFVKQATMDIVYSTLKMLLIVGLVFAGFGVGGAVVGFVGSAAIVCVVAGIWVWRILRAASPAPKDLQLAQAAEPTEEAPLKRLLGYLVLIMAYTFALNALMRADLFILKRVAAEIPPHLAGAEGLFNLLSSKFAGLYGAALNIARIPYMGVIAVTFVIFPLISASTFAEDRARTQGYIHETFRYCLLLIAGVGGLLALNSDAIITGLYASEYQAAAPALAILSVSIIFFALYYVATTIIIGAGRPAVAVVIMLISLLISGALNFVLIQKVHQENLAELTWTPLQAATADSAPDAVANALAVAQNHTELAGSFLFKGPQYMTWAAIATTIAMFIGFLLSLLWLWRSYRAALPLATTLRVSGALLVLFILGRFAHLPQEWVEIYGKLVFLGLVAVKMAVMGALFLGLLFLLREFGPQDIARVKAVIGKKK